MSKQYRSSALEKTIIPGVVFETAPVVYRLNERIHRYRATTQFNKKFDCFCHESPTIAVLYPFVSIHYFQSCQILSHCIRPSFLQSAAAGFSPCCRYSIDNLFVGFFFCLRVPEPLNNPSLREVNHMYSGNFPFVQVFP